MSGHVPFKCYVREGFASKVSKITEKHFNVGRPINSIFNDVLKLVC